MAESKEQLNKSIDQMIDAFFSKSEQEKPMDEPGSPKESPEKKKKSQMEELTGESKESSLMKEGSDAAQAAKTTADAGIAGAPAPEHEVAGERGRPKEIRDIPQSDSEGKADGNYDADITAPATPPPHEDTVAKAKSDKVEISKEDFELLTQAKKDKEQEVLRKAREEQATLIKSIVSAETKKLKDENDKLGKKLDEATNLIKAIAKRPRQPKSITNVQALEKSFSQEENSGSATFTKSEMLDAAEKLCKSGQLTVENVIELENNGFIYNPEARRKLESELKKQG